MLFVIFAVASWNVVRDGRVQVQPSKMSIQVKHLEMKFVSLSEEVSYFPYVN